VAHAEVPIKVTTLVDRGVVPLVRALDEYETVLAVASCENDPHFGGAYVMFRATEDADKLGSRLARSLTDAPDYRLQAEWRPGESEPLLTLSCPPDQVELVAGLLSAARSSVSACDTERTALRS
jgi:hypothetical protein